MYIKFPTTPPNFDLEQFKDDYLSTTGETLQGIPLENKQETHYMIGSSRITNSQFDALKDDYPTISKTNNWPAGWVTKE